MRVRIAVTVPAMASSNERITPGLELALLRGAQPFRRDRLRALVPNQLPPAGLLFGADRSRVLAKFRSQCHRLLDGRPLAYFFQPALYVRELVDVDFASRPARGPGIADHVGDRVFAGGEIALVEQTEVHDPKDPMCLIVEAANGVG